MISRRSFAHSPKIRSTSPKRVGQGSDLSDSEGCRDIRLLARTFVKASLRRPLGALGSKCPIIFMTNDERTCQPSDGCRLHRLFAQTLSVGTLAEGHIKSCGLADADQIRCEVTAPVFSAEVASRRRPEWIS